MSVANIQVRPMHVFIGKDQSQVQTIKTVVGTSLGGKYFLFHDSAGAKHYAWFNTGASTDPAPAGNWTECEVAILVGDTAGQVATKLATALAAVTGFDAVASGTTVTLTHTATGYSQPARDVDTTFAFAVTVTGSLERNIGEIQGDIELGGFEQQKVEITTHAGGSTVQKEIVSGYAKPEVAFTLQETDKETIKKVLVDYGMHSMTPVGADKEEIFGYGPANVGGSNPKVLVRLHPTELDATDKSEDFNFWSCELQLESLTFSGESVSTLPLSFSVYPDQTKPKAIQFLMIGDAAKAGY